MKSKTFIFDMKFVSSKKSLSAIGDLQFIADHSELTTHAKIAKFGQLIVTPVTVNCPNLAIIARVDNSEWSPINDMQLQVETFLMCCDVASLDSLTRRNLKDWVLLHGMDSIY